jgi:polyribonucleotide nucleotidyltransferase
VQTKKGEMLINPKNSELVDVNYQLFASGPVDRINMIEAEGIEASEAEALKGFELAQAEINKLVAFQNSIVAKIGKKKQVVQLAELDEALKTKVSSFVAGKLEPAIYAPTKMEHEAGLAKIFADLADSLKAEGADAVILKAGADILEEMINDIVHKTAIEKGKRPDGRGVTDIRELHAQVGLLKQTHGSALFIRGNTQSLSVATQGQRKSSLAPLSLGLATSACGHMRPCLSASCLGSSAEGGVSRRSTPKHRTAKLFVRA